MFADLESNFGKLNHPFLPVSTSFVDVGSVQSSHFQTGFGAEAFLERQSGVVGSKPLGFSKKFQNWALLGMDGIPPHRS